MSRASRKTSRLRLALRTPAAPADPVSAAWAQAVAESSSGSGWDRSSEIEKGSTSPAERTGPPEPMVLGGIEPLQPLGDPAAAVQDLEDRAARLAETSRRVLRDLDEEAIHDLRVATRRYISSANTWRGLLVPQRRRKLVRRVRALRRRAGNARDLEVHVGLIEQLAERREDLERQLLQTLRSRVLREWVEAVASVQRGLDRKSLIKPDRALARSLLPSEERALAWPAVARFARERCAARAEAAETLLRTAQETLSDELLHRARIGVKQWRYALERLEAAGLASSTERLEQLRGLQQVLGDIHDLATLMERIVKAADADDDPLHRTTWSAIERRVAEARTEAVKRFEELAPSGT
jgi:CHAD domain-containing protein